MNTQLSVELLMDLEKYKSLLERSGKTGVTGRELVAEKVNLIADEHISKDPEIYDALCMVLTLLKDGKVKQLNKAFEVCFSEYYSTPDDTDPVYPTDDNLQRYPF